MTLRFGTDGVRGVALTQLTPQFVASLGRAAADVLHSDRWLVGRDTRESGPQLTAAFAAGVGAAIVDDLGVLPTPAVAYWSQRLNLPAAVITASHNAWSDNGVKIFAPGGVKLTDDVEAAIEAALGQQVDVPVVFDVMPTQAADAYIDHLTEGRPALGALRIVIDCANGAMSKVAPLAFARLGAHAVVIHDQPDGRNINDRCGATAPASLAASVVQHGADLGLAFDGDGDRVIAVDHFGNIVDGDRMLALAALQLRDAGDLVDDTVVVTVMSNLGFHRAMARANVNVVTTAVGDRYVLEALDAGGYSLGGEQSGHIIYRHLATTGDGLLAGLRLAQDVIDRGRPLAQLAADVMTSYPQVLVNVRVADRHPDIAVELASDVEAAEAALEGEGRVLLRPSGTEPLVRVMVEAATVDIASATAERLASVVRARWGG
ncbi:MAG: glmM [Ilumatobacteraceae bacterium]|nr:glmM [Ilumatobacteraceae bacterium]